MCLLRDVRQSGFEATLLVDPVDELLEVKGIGKALLDKNREKLQVN